MKPEDLKRSIRKELFSDPDQTPYAVVDGASAKELLHQLKTCQPKHCCLFTGELHPEIAQTAPYLVLLEQDAPFIDWLINNWGHHFGIFALAPEYIDFREIRKHFRRFLMVRDPDGKTLYFRFYDPRVLKVYLPTCNHEETRTFFGPLNSYILEEAESNTLLRFWAELGQPKSEQILLEEEQVVEE